MGDPGKYRTVNVRAGSHIAPNYIKLYNLIPAYFEFYQQRLPTMHPFELAAEMKYRLVHIHPFLDGNGRTARLVMNLLLMQAGYPLVNIKGDRENRAKYIDSLEQTNLGDEMAFFRYLKGVALEDYRKLLQILQPKDTPLQQ
jgi:Fic family protein